jgi:hypothetical protein
MILGSWDFDDDNILLADQMSLPGISIVEDNAETLTLKQEYDVLEPEFKTKSLFFNPYPYMGTPTKVSWPRGYPLELIKGSAETDKVQDWHRPGVGQPRPRCRRHLPHDATTAFKFRG